jgi:hypothetical protein
VATAAGVAVGAAVVSGIGFDLQAKVDKAMRVLATTACLMVAG